MTGEPWLSAALVVMAALHLLVAWYARCAHGDARVTPGTESARAAAGEDGDVRSAVAGDDRAGTDAGSAAGEARAAPAARDADLVACRHCGTLNERGYARCRDCIGVLPGGDGRVRTTRPVGGSLLR